MMTRVKLNDLFRSLTQSALSLSMNLGGMLAGALLAFNIHVFSVAPWAIVLFPCVLSVRGAIGGLFSGRLSTALHLGVVKAAYTENTRYFYTLFSSIVVIALEGCLLMSSVAFLFSAIVWSVPLGSYVEMLAVTMGVMSLSLIFVSPITIGISFLSFRRGFDPDVVVYPITSTVADIIVTGCYIMLLGLFFHGGFSWLLICSVDVIFLAAALYIFLKNYGEFEFMKTLREFLLTLFLITLIVNVTGFILSGIKMIIGNRPEIYAIYPALIDTIGDVGSIVGSTATTKLFMGVIKPSIQSIKEHLTEIAGAWMASLIMFTLYFAIATSTYGVYMIDSLKFLLEVIGTNIIAVSTMSIISYMIAISTFRRALNPDNFVIPIESSIADTVTTISLFITLLIKP